MQRYVAVCVVLWPRKVLSIRNLNMLYCKLIFTFCWQKSLAKHIKSFFCLWHCVVDSTCNFRFLLFLIPKDNIFCLLRSPYLCWKVLSLDIILQVRDFNQWKCAWLVFIQSTYCSFALSCFILCVQYQNLSVHLTALLRLINIFLSKRLLY